jgi:hypothetical protein
MRPVANPRAQDVPLFETRTVSSNCDPEWEEGVCLVLVIRSPEGPASHVWLLSKEWAFQFSLLSFAEFHLPVNDANQSQLEVTVWDTAETQAFPAPFMGECILNLSKLVPYQGEIIMQDFDVKQGKQHKTQVLAAGKLILQLELTGGEIAPALPAPPAPVQQPSVVLPPGKEKFVMNLVVVEARDLSKVADDPDSYVCLTLLDDPQSMQTSHFHALDHGIGQTSREIIVLTPQHRTKICPSNLNPTWNDGCTLAEAHPSILLVQQAQQNGQGPADKVALVGQPVLLMFTVLPTRLTRKRISVTCARQTRFNELLTVTHACQHAGAQPHCRLCRSEWVPWARRASTDTSRDRSGSVVCLTDARGARSCACSRCAHSRCRLMLDLRIGCIDFVCAAACRGRSCLEQAVNRQAFALRSTMGRLPKWRESVIRTSRRIRLKFNILCKLRLPFRSEPQRLLPLIQHPLALLRHQLVLQLPPRQFLRLRSRKRREVLRRFRWARDRRHLTLGQDRRHRKSCKLSQALPLLSMSNLLRPATCLNQVETSSRTRTHAFRFSATPHLWRKSISF